MKVLNGDIFNAKEPLEKVIQLPLPVKTSLQVAKFANKLGEELKAIEDVRMGLIQKYGKKSEDGQQISVDQTSPNYGKFIDEFNELMMTKTELVVDKIKLPSNVDGKELNIEPATLMALEKFIELED